MIYMALTVVYLLACATLGLARGRRSVNVLVTAALAAAIVCAQFALLLTR
jgi:hypothetical protein